MDEGGDSGLTFDLPEEMPQGPSEEETPIIDGEDLGFGSDSSVIEEAPSDYSDEFQTWEIFGDEDILDTTAAVAQTSRSSRNDWEPFNSQEVMNCYC
jgi:hypothetical protein